MLTPGMRTSEFALTILTAVGGILSGAENWVPNKYAWVGVVLATIGYAISRGQAKTEPREPTAQPGTPPGAAK
jgi:hypothetical protein